MNGTFIFVPDSIFAIDKECAFSNVSSPLTLSWLRFLDREQVLRDLDKNSFESEST
jgi:hypothetical protein